MWPDSFEAATRFRDRVQAGRVLGRRLEHHLGDPGLIVLGLARGGVPVAYEVAQHLEAPLDAFIVRKLGVPGHEELAMGAIANGGVRVLDHQEIRALGITDDEVDAVYQRERRELSRREAKFRDVRPPPLIRGRTVVLVDDGLATGASMVAAVQAIRQQEPARIIVGVPVSSPDVCAAFQRVVDEIVCVMTPSSFRAVGAWYEDFSDPTDDEIRRLLNRSRADRPDIYDEAFPRRRHPLGAGHGAEPHLNEASPEHPAA
jgi:putative phosphoribosyl transferase